MTHKYYNSGPGKYSKQLIVELEPYKTRRNYPVENVGQRDILIEQKQPHSKGRALLTEFLAGEGKEAKVERDLLLVLRNVCWRQQRIVGDSHAVPCSPFGTALMVA